MTIQCLFLFSFQSVENRQIEEVVSSMYNCFVAWPSVVTFAAQITSLREHNRPGFAFMASVERWQGHSGLSGGESRMPGENASCPTCDIL